MELIGIRKLNNTYDRYASQILGSNGYIQRACSEAEGNGHAKYEILRPLPTVDEYRALERTAHTFELDSLLDDAFSDLEGLKDELQDWYDNLPEQFQQGDKGQTLEQAISCLDNAQQPIVPAWIIDAEYKVYFQPLIGFGHSRSARCSECIDKINTCVEFLRALEEENPDAKDDIDSLADDLENAVLEIESVEFPGMYS